MTLSTSTRRAALFRTSRPLVRKYEDKDAGFLWAAYKSGSFDFQNDLTQEAFLLEVAKRFGGFPFLWIVEDDSRHFRTGRGQIAIVGLHTDGWSWEPYPLFFRWATPRNILRACVSFFQMVRHQKDVGVCIVKSHRKDMKLLKRMEKYGVLYLRGRVPFGTPNGDLWLFSIDGKKKNKT